MAVKARGRSAFSLGIRLRTDLDSGQKEIEGTGLYPSLDPDAVQSTGEILLAYKLYSGLRIIIRLSSLCPHELIKYTDNY